MTREIHVRAVGFCAVMITVVGCGELHTPAQAVSVSVALGPPSCAALSDEANTLELSLLRVALEVGLHSSGDQVEAEPEEAAYSLFAGEVSPSDPVLALGSMNAARGSYDRLQLRLRPLDDERGADLTVAQGPLSALLEGKGAWAAIDGTFNGRPFDYRAHSEAAAALRLPGPLTVKLGEVANVTVRFDCARWFRAKDARLIDPSTGDEAALTGAIVLSASALRDNDMDGRDDDPG